MMDDLKIIKKLYGEKMMYLCRELFPTILERTNELSNLLQSLFEPSKILYQDLVNQNAIDEFKNYIYNVYDNNNIRKDKSVKKTPKELLSEAGYDLFECKTEKDIQKFRKYYRYGEELCTFNGGRLDNCYVFFAVKKDVKRIKRSDFKNPQRQDEYGTSVISIQFSKDSHNTLSIKNRYNHKVPNPDATFSNNLDNIIPGLADSFRKYYKFNFKYDEEDFELDDYIKANDEKFYKFNCEYDNIYYCPNNIIIDNFQVKRDYQQMERYIVLDYFIIDLKEKKIELYDKNIKDGFIDDLVNIEKIDIAKDKETGNKEIIILIEGQEPIVIKIDRENNIIGYINNNIEEIGNDFLNFNHNLKELSLSNVKTIGDRFLYKNVELEEICLPEVKVIGDSFIECGYDLNKITLPNLEKIGDMFLRYNKKVNELNLPKVKTIGNDFLWFNEELHKILLPKVKTIGNEFLEVNNKLKSIELPTVRSIGDGFLENNYILESIYLPYVKKIGNEFLLKNQGLKTVLLPTVEKIKNKFLMDNKNIKNVYLPKLESIGVHFLENNKNMVNIIFSKSTIKPTNQSNGKIISVHKVSKYLTDKTCGNKNKTKKKVLK